MLDAKQLRKLRRSDLFELLVEQAKEIEELQGQVKELEGKLERRELEVTDAGSIAEAALAISKVFEEAQAAADTYLYNVKRMADAKNNIDIDNKA
ncbi:DNA repair protein [Streptococcus equinus]|uniref:DNA repair protein n=1 Tax=Streptococcus equinus TaxID=1335 RepID=UPI003C6FB50D